VQPCEVAASPDAVTLHNIWPDCALIGGMDRREIASGCEGVDAELERIHPVLAEGACDPFPGHLVPSDVSYETYLYYAERRRDLLGGPRRKVLVWTAENE
jgi:hypothetical protein